MPIDPKQLLITEQFVKLMFCDFALKVLIKKTVFYLCSMTDISFELLNIVQTQLFVFHRTDEANISFCIWWRVTLQNVQFLINV